MKKMVLIFICIVLLLGSCASGAPVAESNQPTEQSQPTVTVSLNTNTPSGYIVPGANIDFFRNDVSATEAVWTNKLVYSVKFNQGNAATAGFGKFKLYKYADLSTSFGEAYLIEEQIIFNFSPEGRPYLETNDTLCLKGDATGEGIFSVSLEEMEGFGTVNCQSVNVQGLPVIGSTLILGSPTIKPYISVISPNGEEVFVAGETIPFSWQWTGDVAPLEPAIYLYSVDLDKTIYGSLSDIHYEPENDIQTGEFTALAFYRIINGQPDGYPPEFIPGGRYKIKICEYPEGSNNPSYPNESPICDFSDGYFSIVVPTPTPLITLLSPNGEEEWTIGETYNIRWESQGLETVAGINLIDYTPGDRYGYQYGIASMVPASSGNYSWTIPSNIVPGIKYKVVTGYESTNDFSDGYFSIIEPNTGLTVEELQKMISNLLLQINDLQNQLSEIEVAKQNLQNQMDALLAQLATLQKKLEELR